MIHQIDIYGKDMVEVSIERLKAFEPKEGYYLALSGGKDSVVCKKLCDLAGVKYDAHYNVTSVDPPELVRFIKQEYPDVKMEVKHWETDGIFVKAGQPITMWNLIPEKLMPPTRILRYCCEYLKESGGHGRKVITGVRWAESPNRRKNQGLVSVRDATKSMTELAELYMEDFQMNTKGGIVMNNDNDDTREFVEHCYRQAKTSINPIIDWKDSDIWEFIHEYKVPYCHLYDEGFKRLGCIGCPMSTHNKKELELYPKYKQLYLKAFGKMIKARGIRGLESDNFTSPEAVMEWWLDG